MVLREESVRQRLLRLEEVISHLAELVEEETGGAGGSFRLQWAIERGLQLGCEIVLDIGNHILSAHFGTSAKDYEDILSRLQRERVIAPSLRARLAGLGGFRNLLVHDYLEIDPDRVREHLQKAPQDFSAFIAAIRTWLATVT